MAWLPQWSALLICWSPLLLSYASMATVCRSRQLLVKTSNLGDLNHQTQSIWTTVSAAPSTAKTLDLGLAFFFALFLSFSSTEKNFYFRKACSLCYAWRHISVIPVRTAFCLLTVNNVLPLNLMKSILKCRQLQTSMVRDVQTQRSTVFSFLLLHLL